MDDKDAQTWKIRRPVLGLMLGRINSDILLLQEVNALTALDSLRAGTPYAGFHLAHTKTKQGKPLKTRNLVILSRWPIAKTHQYQNRWTRAPRWQKVTADPEEKTAKPIGWERPIFHAEVTLANNKTLHVINLHLKSMLPSAIQGQQSPDPKKWYLWLSHAGWAEGYYLSDVKRVGQALETRVLVDKLFEKGGNEALIVVGGDLNADIGSVPFKAITGSVDDTSNPELRPTMLVPCELNVPSDQRYSLIHRGKGNMIDHILVSQAFYPHWNGTAIYNEVLPDESIAFATEQKFPESDHAPVVAHFAVPNNWLP